MPLFDTRPEDRDLIIEEKIVFAWLPVRVDGTYVWWEPVKRTTRRTGGVGGWFDDVTYSRVGA